MSSKITLAPWPSEIVPATKTADSTSDDVFEILITDDEREQTRYALDYLGTHCQLSFSLLTRHMGEKSDLKTILKNRVKIYVSYLEKIATACNLSLSEFLAIGSDFKVGKTAMTDSQKEEMRVHLKAVDLFNPRKSSTTPPSLFRDVSLKPYH